MTAILGISAFYHDSAAALVVDGRIVAAAQEERFTRLKHENRFPQKAVAYVLQAGGITAADLDYVGFYEKPLLKFDRLLETYLAYAPRGFRSFARAMPQWLRCKLHLTRQIRRGLGGAYPNRIVFPEHHESHAASAFFPSPFESAAIVTMDGVGEWTTTSIGSGAQNRIALTREIRFPHSLGLLYSAFTYFCGFRVNSGEYKLMGLAPYGEPRYTGRIKEHLIDIRPDGSYRLDMSYFNYCQGLTMTSRRFQRLFDGPPRPPQAPITRREMDLAASIQKVAEEVILKTCRHAHTITGQRRLCLAGGVALNCVANGRLLREGPFEDIWIQPAAGDAGGALGTALFIHHQLLNRPRRPQDPDAQQASALGPAYAAPAIEAQLQARRAVYHRFSRPDELLGATTDLLAAQRVVGWMQGRMEFGPRALGQRSILADARSADMQSVINHKIKFRESFRPFAPAVLAEHAAAYFDMPRQKDSPYMLMVAPVQPARRLPVRSAARGLEQIDIPRSTIPAVTHVDHSARVQTVDAERHGRFYHLLKTFEARTGSPVLVNTSFNVRGEPIVNTPAEAFNCFMATQMDALVIENFLLLKSEQRKKPMALKPLDPPAALCTAAEDYSAGGPPPAPRNPEPNNPITQVTVSPNQLRLFGLLLTTALVVCAWRLPPAAAPLAVAVLASALLTVFSPAALRPVYRILTAVTMPLGLLLSRIILALIFYLFLTPLACLLRLIGRDTLDRKTGRRAATYWVSRPANPDPARYFHTY